MLRVTTRELPVQSGAAPAEPPALRPPLPQRLYPPMPTGPWTWLGPLLVTIFGGVLRFLHLGRPHAVVFDETYYVKDAYSILRFGYERAYVDSADTHLLAGQTDLYRDRATFVVHPPIGKWIIAAGEKVAGLDPFGWRLGVAILGTLSIFLICRVAMRMTRSILLGCVAGLLLSLDGLALVMSRTALLDGILSFFVLAGFACLLVDRDRCRERLAAGLPPPRLRPWRLVAGLCLGLAVGTKWSAVPFIAALGLMTVLWDAGARRATGQRRPMLTALRRDAPPAFAALVLLPMAVYLASWSGWLATGGGWSRKWAEGRDSSFAFIPDPLRSLWHYHSEILTFHTHLTQEHPYQSSPWGWSVLARPVAYYSTNLTEGQDGCDAPKCVREVLGIGTPALWWTATAALLYMVWRWAGARDWRAGAVLGAVAAGWLPWFRYGDRPIFYFYAIAFLPFLVLAVTFTLGDIIGPAPDPETATVRTRRRRAIGAAVAGSVVALVVVNFFYLYPVLTAGTLPRPAWLDRMWFRSWI
jgi:dolichyl-phosphate-mannose--protein O-mannosyl transferase